MLGFFVDEVIRLGSRCVALYFHPLIPAGGRVEDDPLEVRTRFTGLSTINVIIYYVVET